MALLKIYAETSNDIPKINVVLNGCDLHNLVSENENKFYQILIENCQINSIVKSIDEFRFDQRCICYFPNIDFKSKSYLNKVPIEAIDLEDLFHRLLLITGKKLIEWNNDFVFNLDNITTLLHFKNEVEKNENLIILYKKEFTVEDHWYNKVTYVISIFNKIYSFLEKLNQDLVELPIIPSIDDILKPNITFWDKIFGDASFKNRQYNESIKKKEALINSITIRHKQLVELNDNYKDYIKNYKKYLKNKFSDDRFHSFELNIKKYESGQDIIWFVNSLLQYSIINSFYNFTFSLEQVDNNRHIVCNISLPNDSEISKVKAYKEYVRDDRIEPKYHSERDFKKLYDSILYSIYFRVINEIFSSDYSKQLERLSLNGWVNSLNKKNGKYQNKCIISLSISRDQFCEMNISDIDLLQAFRHLKGISAASLYDNIPVQPILDLNKSDKRFIQSEDVLEKLGDSTNIAAIDWEEFEHLVRELFEKEFSVNGGEVKVTQSSRDGGVDAVAFDPDPIRGGKIIIQSKRYTNVVGVSAIRDLYGTVVNEGATKGIIVTTSHYGSDAYEFAKGKPLTLLDGNNLLYLLEKHGYKAKIDIEEAKKLFKI